MSRKTTWIGVVLGLAVLGVVLTPAEVSAQQQSFGNSVGSSIKGGFDKVTNILTPKSSAPSVPDQISLGVKGKLDPEFHVAVARMAEQSGKVGEARQHYELALKLNPNHYGSLLNYARLKDRQGQFNEAIALYQRAAGARPKSATALNDLALCLARRRMLRESVRTLEAAIRIQPSEALYRNNIATVLIELDEVDAAKKHLRAVHGEAVACYNLAYLLQKRGRTDAASRLFAEAAARDPSLKPAQVWLEKLGKRPPAKASVAGRPSGPTAPQPRASSAGVAPLPPSLRPSMLPREPVNTGLDVRRLPPIR